MPKKLPVILLLIFICFRISGQTDSSRHIVMPHVNPALKFTENKGQWDNKILFRAQLDGGALYLEKNCLTFDFYDKKKYRSIHHGGFARGGYKDMNIKCHAYKVFFKGCNPVQEAEKRQKGSDYENFFIGSDQSKWQSNVRNYHQVFLRNLYKGIDYEAITSARGLKYNFYVKAGADPAVIQLEYAGVSKMKLKNGSLTFSLTVNEVVEQKPYAYQLINNKVKQVACRYTLKNNILAFEFPEGYNKNYELVIDPVLLFAAQSGSTADNFGMTATYDKNGNLYAGGTVFNNGYPTAPAVGAYDITFAGPVIYGITDVVITKYNATGTALDYSTYLGGLQAEIVTSMVTDANNNLYLYGATGSSDFPMAGTPYDASFNGGTYMFFQFNGTKFNFGTDIYVCKFNSTGTSLLASTYIGGSANDGVNYNNYAPPTQTVFPCFAPGGYVLPNEYPADSLQYNYGDQYRGEIQLDKNDNVYVASSTKSSNFPTVNALQNALNGPQDAVVFKFSNNLSTLLYSTYLGGSKNDAGYSLIIDDNFQAYVTGGTTSPDFPVVAGCYQTTAGGGKADGYIAKISATGGVLQKASYVGTASYDQSYFIQSDRIGRIYIFGQSLGNMPVSPGIYANPNSHQFLMRFDDQLTTLDKSTVIGSGTASLDISPSAFSVDKCSGSISLTGWGGNFISCLYLNNMPVTPDAFQGVSPNGHDFYFMVLQPNFLSLKYGTYFGGNLSEEHVDGGTSRISESGVLYQSICAGCGGNNVTGANQDFPVTPGAWPGIPGAPNQNTDNFNCNNGVAKFDYQPKVNAAIGSNTIAGCNSVTITYNNLSSPGLQYLWNLGGGPNDTTSQIINPVHTYTNVGSYTITLLVIEKQFCNTRDSTTLVINVYPTPTVNFSFSTTPCTNTILTSNSSVGNFGPNPFLWNFGNSATSTLSAPSYTYPGNGSYSISLTATDIKGCSNTLSKPLSIFNFSPGVASSGSVCNGSGIQVTASGGTSYTWTPAGSLSGSTIAAPFAQPSVTTVYTINVFNNTFGFPCAGTVTTQVLVRPAPTASFSYSGNPCGGGMYFTDLSAINITDWNWRLAPGITSTVQNPYHFYATGGNFNVRLIVTNNFGCKDSIAKPLSVVAPPLVSVSASTMICKGNSVQLSASGGTAYAWTPTVSIDYPFLNNPTSSPLTSTQYSVVITTTNYVNGLPCTFLLVTNVDVMPPSVIPAGAQANPRVVVTGNATTLTYIGDPGYLVTWYPPGSTTPPNGYVVTAKPDRPTTYTAVATRSACSQQAEVSVEAYTEGCIDKDAFVPNTFTPNGDNKNDIFLVRGLKIEDIYFAVYNRWGELVFETTDKTQGWDGIYKGRPADVGVFGWYLKARCINGEETFRKGNVTLIR
jgi:gliding motility-associated-like protein